MQALASTSSTFSGTSVQQRQSTGRSTCKQAVQAEKQRFFDRPKGDKKESKRWENSEVRKMKTQRIPKDNPLAAAWPGKSKKMKEARARGPAGDGRTMKTSSNVPGSTSLPAGTPIVAGGGALLLIVVALLATGGLVPPPLPPQ